MEDIITYLKNYGLTEYEAKVYNSVVNQDISTATEISIESGVPRARIYDVLSTLARKGWVRIIDGSPTKYVSVDIEEVKALLDKKEKEMKKAKDQVLLELRSNLKDENEQTEEKPLDILLNHKETLKTLSFHISKAKTQIRIHNLKQKWFETIIPDLLKAKKRGVNIQIILYNKGFDLKFKRKLQRDFNVKETNLNFEYGNFLFDYKLYFNTYYRKNDLQANMVSFKKCTYCLNAWMEREWDSI